MADINLTSKLTAQEHVASAKKCHPGLMTFINEMDNRKSMPADLFLTFS